MKKHIFFVFGAISAGLVQGIALGAFGAFQDSANYYELYESIAKNGFFEGLISFITQTSKVEPIIVFIFWLENFFSASTINENSFLILNMVLLNAMISLVMYPMMDKKYKNIEHMFLIGFIVMSGYLAFSKELYFWRNIISLSLFILMIRDRSRIRYIWAALSIAAHSASTLFIVLFFLSEYIAELNKRSAYLLFFTGMLGLIILTQEFPQLFGVVASGGDASVFLSEGGEHTLKVWLSILFSLTILILIYSEYINDQRLRPIFVFCLATVLASLVSFNSYHFMNRMFLPASMIIGFLPFLIKKSSQKFKLARFFIVISILPTVRLIAMLFSGTFTPA